LKEKFLINLKRGREMTMGAEKEWILMNERRRWPIDSQRGENGEGMAEKILKILNKVP
jgi:hypothetical protein